MSVSFPPPGPLTASGMVTDTEDMYFDSASFQAVPEPAEIIDREHGDCFMCKKWDVGLLSSEGFHHHMRSGKGENGDRKNLYYGKCRADGKDESGLKVHKMESSKHVICRDYSPEFGVDREFVDHWNQVHKSKPGEIHPCPGCGSLFTAISGIIQHIESEWCEGKISAEEFRKLVNYANAPLAKKNLPARILPGSTTTHTWRAGIPLQQAKTTLGESPNVFKPDELVPKDVVSVLDFTLPNKQVSPPMGNLNECWNEKVKAYVCPRPMCKKKFAGTTALKAHLDSNTHDQKSFRCPTCHYCFVSSSSLIQHAGSDACGVKSSPAYGQLVKGDTSGFIARGENAGYKTCWQKPYTK